jgi:hypothetical protein
LDEKLNLEVRGVCLDKITNLTTARTPESFSRSAFSRWIKDGLYLAKKQCMSEDEERMANLQMYVEEAYGRTVIGDIFTEADGCNCRATLEDIKLLYNWIQWLNDNVQPKKRDWGANQPPPIFNEIASSFLMRTQSRRFFTTKDKRLGMGVSTVFGQEREIECGDEVWLMKGSNLPVILRPIPKKIKQRDLGHHKQKTPYTMLWSVRPMFTESWMAKH